MRNTSVMIEIGDIHIHAARRSGRWNPAEIAILQQTTYLPVGYMENRMQLLNEQGVEFSCDLPPELAEFLDHFGRGVAVLPCSFTLNCLPLN